MKNSKIYLPQIKHIVAIASGKGGVGKSTVAFSLALHLSQSGYKVGLLDADLYGPSVPLFMDSTARPSVRDKKYVPHFLQSIHTMSLGFLLKEEEPVMWRGPILQTALRQLFTDVLWPNLDFLIVDMPPGTGDAHLSIGQSVDLRGVVMVSTAQYLALQDTSRCIRMFQKMTVPIWGLVGNMSSFQCSHCHTVSPLFQSNDILDFCKTVDVNYWDSLPYLSNLDGNLRTLDKTESFYKSIESIGRKFLEAAHI
jgi:ATP-binding protein involved in chromosome partitioning